MNGGAGITCSLLYWQLLEYGKSQGCWKCIKLVGIELDGAEAQATN